MQCGYGVCFYDAEEIRPLALVKEFPEDYEEYKEWLGEEEEDEQSCGEWLDKFSDGGYFGFAPFFASRVGEAEHIELSSEDHYGCVVFPEMFPWNMTEREKNITKEEINEIFRKWVRLITDDVLEIRYYAINEDCNF